LEANKFNKNGQKYYKKIKNYMQNFLATTKLQLYKKSQSPQSDLFLLLAVVSTQQKVMATKKNPSIND